MLATTLLATEQRAHNYTLEGLNNISVLQVLILNDFRVGCTLAKLKKMLIKLNGTLLYGTQVPHIVTAQTCKGLNNMGILPPLQD
jgi:hypothetical protein